MESDRTPLVETNQLKKYFKVSSGELHAVDGVSIKIETGTTLGVVGESGCGKSTLGRTILQLIPPTGGKVFYKGEDITGYNSKEMKRIRREMQIIFQDPFSSLNPRMTVFEIIAEYMYVNKVYKSNQEIWNRTAELMDIVGLARRLANSYPHELDGGRRQRIGIARALSLNPKFIVCDEPVSALDVSIQAQILNLLMDLQSELGLTYMFITHNMAVVKHISKEIAVMYLGQCIEKAPVDELFNNPLHPYTKALLAAIPIPSSSMRNKEITVIKGEVTNPINPPDSCRFFSRCEYAKPICQAATPTLMMEKEDHYVACTLYDK